VYRPIPIQYQSILKLFVTGKQWNLFGLFGQKYSSRAVIGVQSPTKSNATKFQSEVPSRNAMAASKLPKSRKLIQAERNLEDAHDDFPEKNTKLFFIPG